MTLKLIHKILEKIYLRLTRIDDMFTPELTKAINDLTAAVNTAIPLIGGSGSNDAAVVAALAPITASLVAATGGGVTPPGGPGPTQSFTVASTPVNLSTFVLNSPNGVAITFQFPVGGATPNAGIPVLLPTNAGPSDVLNALAAVLTKPSAADVNGAVIPLPFTFNSSGNSFTVAWSVVGTAVPASGTQSGITAN